MNLYHEGLSGKDAARSPSSPTLPPPQKKAPLFHGFGRPPPKVPVAVL